MLLIFSLLHLLFIQVSSEAAMQGSLEPPRPSVDNSNGRTLFDIVWGCITTVFACTWVAVHPNVPPPNPRWIGLMWRRLKMMVIALIAPELMVGFAARQLVFSRKFSAEFQISWTHGFFISMGGFVTQTGHYPIVTKEQLNEPAYLAAIKAVREETIMDKSKGDALSKGVALAQGIWFVTQYAARVHQSLPVTELEVATLAFAIVNVLVWLLWWGKPLDVQDPIALGPFEDILPMAAPAALRIDSDVSDSFFGMFGATYPQFHPLSNDSVPSFWSVSNKDDTDNEYTFGPFLVECFVGSIFGAIHCAAWKADFSTTNERWLWQSCALIVSITPLLMLLFLLHLRNPLGIDLNVVFLLICALLIPLYVFARLFLIGVFIFLIFKSMSSPQGRDTKHAGLRDGAVILK